MFLNKVNHNASCLSGGTFQDWERKSADANCDTALGDYNPRTDTAAVKTVLLYCSITHVVCGMAEAIMKLLLFHIFQNYTIRMASSL